MPWPIPISTLRTGLPLGLLGGLMFVLVLAWGYRDLDPAHYTDRDDGVITMSHARNLVDHGFIGVEPSGQRVEGFSAPLQFWLYAGLYAVTGIGWHDYGQLQTLACTFLIGFFLVRCMERRPLAALLAGLAMAALLALQERFLAWHGSGMENALLHAAIAMVLWMGVRALDEGRLPWHWGVWLGAALLVRLDTIFHLLPLLLFFGLAYRREWRSWRGMGVVGLAVGIWGLYQLWRWRYFGSLEPNTGLAQQISVGLNLRRLLAGDPHWLGEGGRLGLVGLRVHGAWIAPLALIPLLWARAGGGTRWVVVACLSLLVTGFFNPLVFGITRLDTVRTTTFMSLAVAMLAGRVLAEVPWRREPLATVVAGAGVCAGLLAWPALADPKPRLCCAIDGHAALSAQADAYAAANNLHRVTLANPDLGKLSYLKRHNLFDLGFLGSPVLSHLRGEEDWVRSYFFDYALPDVVEVHGEWCRLHARILGDARFAARYEPLSSSTEELGAFAKEWPTVSEGVFVRRDLHAGSASPEHGLIQSLRAGADLGPVRAALAGAVVPGDPTAHQWVVRTAYRFLPEFREAGLEGELAGLFAQTPSAAYDQAMLASADRRTWCADALCALVPRLRAGWLSKFTGADAGHPPRVVMEHGRWRLYTAPGRRAWLSVMNPTQEELGGLWFVHVYARHGRDVSPSNPWNALFIELGWDATRGRVAEGEHVMPLQLPRFAIKGMLVGCSLAGQVAWTEHIAWPLGWL